MGRSPLAGGIPGRREASSQQNRFPGPVAPHPHTSEYNLEYLQRTIQVQRQQIEALRCTLEELHLP